MGMETASTMFACVGKDGAILELIAQKVSVDILYLWILYLSMRLSLFFCDSKGLCPYDIAWSDKAYATETAHAVAECSNRGICDFITVWE